MYRNNNNSGNAYDDDDKDDHNNDDDYAQNDSCIHIKLDNLKIYILN